MMAVAVTEAREREGPVLETGGTNNPNTGLRLDPSPFWPCSTVAYHVHGTSSPMTLSRTAIYGVGGALLVAYLAAANMPGPPAAEKPRAQEPRELSTDAIATDVR